MFFLPFRWVHWVLPKVHLRRSMMICNTVKTSTIPSKQFTDTNSGPDNLDFPKTFMTWALA